jgi:putative ABC transport system permease protein
MAPWARDLRLAARRLGRQPGFAAVAVLTLAVGIGVNTALLAIVRAVLVHPLPFPGAERLVALWETTPEPARARAAVFEDWRAAAAAEAEPVIVSMAAFGSASMALTGAGEPEQLSGSRVSAGYFDVLGVAPVLGRAFREDEERQEAARVALLGEGLWRRRFAADPAIIGRTVTLDGVAHEVVGVMPGAPYPTSPQVPARLQFDPARSQFWVPLVLPRGAHRRRAHVLGVVARLAPGVELERARAVMDEVARRLELDFPESNAGADVRLAPLAGELVGEARTALLAMTGAVALLLLLASANVAGMQLARAAGRSRALVIQAALGARRADLVRGELAEGALLGLGGGALGLALARLALAVLLRADAAPLLRTTGAPIDAPVLATTLGLSLVTALLVAVAPALGAAGRDPGEVLAGGRAPSAAPGRPRLRRGLVAAQAAVAVLLVAVAGLLAESFRLLGRVDPGFDPDGLVAAEVSLPASRYATAGQVTAFYDELLRRAEALPGVRAAALSYDPPLDSNWSMSFAIEGGPTPEGGEDPGARQHTVSPGYFHALGVELLDGAAFTAADDGRRPGVVVVNQALARAYFPGERPVGRRLRISSPRWSWGEGFPESFEIVGVVEDVAFLGLRGGSAPAFYLPARQLPLHQMTLLLRAAGDPRRLGPQVRGVIAAVDRDVPVVSVATLDAMLAADVAQPRFNTALMAGFGAVALALAALGLYGLLAQSVARRQGEIGVRAALGATPRALVVLVLREGLALSLLGAAAGVVAALVAGRLLESLLFGVSARDPRLLLGAPAVLLAAALLAGGIPARHAARLDPATVLRGK